MCSKYAKEPKKRGMRGVFERIPSHMDVHGYRREYAANRYHREIARDPDTYERAPGALGGTLRVERGHAGPDIYRRKDGRKNSDKANLLEGVKRHET